MTSKQAIEQLEILMGMCKSPGLPDFSECIEYSIFCIKDSGRIYKVKSELENAIKNTNFEINYEEDNYDAGLWYGLNTAIEIIDEYI